MDGRSGLSLRAKLTLAFLGIVVAGTVISVLFGASVLTSSLLAQARARVRHGLEATRSVYVDRGDRVGRGVARVASALADTNAPADTTRAGIGAALLALRHAEVLHFVGYFDATTRVAHHASDGGAEPTLPAPLGRLVDAALVKSEVTVGTVVLEPEAMANERADLPRLARIPILPVRFVSPDDRKEIGAGLVLAAACPVIVEGRVVGVAYGGYLVNRDATLVDQVQRLVLFDELFRGRHVGAVSLTLGDVRVATSWHEPGGERAVGSRASAEVARAVLDEGRTWEDRAFVVDAWHVAAYEPIRDPSGAIVGMLSVSMSEAPFLAERDRVMLMFIGVAIAGMLAVILLTVLITRSATRPLEEMADATRRIATGDLELAVPVRTRDEIGQLAAAFNAMVGSLKAMRGELQDWGRTLEEKVRARTEELVAVQAGMAQSEKLASIGRLAAGVAHEINNPLGGILSLAMLRLEDTAPAAPEREDLELISKLTLRCREIVKGLLEFSRQTPSQLARTDVSSVVQTTLALLERQALMNRVRADVQLGRDLPPVVIDPGQLQQVIMNIVLNAVDAMEDGGELTLRTEHDEASGEVRVRIGDTGSGIPDDVLPLIFEPFFTTKAVGKGTGLGLAIVHGIVTRAGGRLTVDTSPRGTTFTVHLPRAPAGDSPARDS